MNTDNQLKISLYYYILICFHYSNNDDYKTKLKMVGMDIDDAEFMSELENKCKTIGKHGWVYSPFVETEPYKTVTYIDDWIDAIRSGHEERIDKYFIDQDYSLLKNLYGRIIHDLINFNQYRFSYTVKESLDNFFDKRYISCAHTLFTTLEGLIRSCKIPQWKWKLLPFFDETTKKEFEGADINDMNDKISLIVEKHLMLPSLSTALERFYSLNSDQQFGKINSIEPDYIQRDWLLHGMTSNNVTQRECIQLFNTIATFLGMRTDLADS